MCLCEGDIVFLDNNIICLGETKGPLRVNFGRGDLKHAKENLAKASHVDMMLYVVLGGGTVERVNIGRSDLKQ